MGIKRNAFDRAYGKLVWDYFENHPDERETFALAMMGRTRFCCAEAPALLLCSTKEKPWK